MFSRSGLVAVTSAIIIAAGCAVDSSTQSEYTASSTPVTRMKPGVAAPEIFRRQPSSAPVTLVGNGPLALSTPAGTPVDLNDIRSTSRAGLTRKSVPTVRGGKRIGSQFSDEQVASAQAAAMEQQFSPSIQNIDKPGGAKPRWRGRFDSIDAADCCTNSGFGATVPPDPHIAAGDYHLIVVVNIAFQIYNKRGKEVTPPIPFADFFAGVPGCTSHDPDGFAAVFDPIVVYDEETRRFVIGIDGNGDSFCVAASRYAGGVFKWNAYGFATNVNGAFFDYPHMGVGPDAIVMGSNQFGGTLPAGFEGRVFAMDKKAMYSGAPMQVITRPLQAANDPDNFKLDGTPQPAHYPASDLAAAKHHYIMGEYFDGKSHAVYYWDDPFGADKFDLMGDVDLAAASGVPCENFECFPVPWVQKDSVEILEANDYRGQNTVIRNDYLWTTQTISCKPGKWTRNCVRWAQIDPKQVMPGVIDFSDFSLASSANGVVQAGVLGTGWAFRQFPALNVNTCNDMVIGYSVGSPSIYPSVAVTGRRSSDVLGKLGGERRLRNGTAPYASFQDNGGAAPQRWGDYTRTAMDPDGKTFWYVGEFAGENVDNEFTNWATVVGKFEWWGCPGY